MRSSTKLVMGSALITGVSLLLVLALLLVLLAELYCSLLRKRRHLRTSSNASTTTVASPEKASADPTTRSPQKSIPSPSSNAYAQGVIQPPPKSFLIDIGKGKEDELEPLQDRPTDSSTKLHYFIGLISTSSSPPSFPSKTKQGGERVTVLEEKEIEEDVGASSGGREHFVYISNPIFEDAGMVNTSTPFETPDTSPSRLEMEESSPSPDRPSLSTPPLTPMKKLPLTASSINLLDGGSSLVASASGTDSNVASSSSSGSPCTSPSW